MKGDHSGEDSLPLELPMYYCFLVHYFLVVLTGIHHRQVRQQLSRRSDPLATRLHHYRQLPRRHKAKLVISQYSGYSLFLHLQSLVGWLFITLPEKETESPARYRGITTRMNRSSNDARALGLVDFRQTFADTTNAVILYVIPLALLFDC